MTDEAHRPVTLDSCGAVTGPFYHGTKARLEAGDLIEPGRGSNYHAGHTARHVYFAALLEPAVWGAELAVALGGAPGPGHVYEVAPTGPFEDDPNLTNQRFPGNPTRSFRSRAPLRVLRELEGWPAHPPATVATMVEGLRAAIAQGRAPLID
jgi:rifampin ADP-ribosylating transferase